MMLNIKVERERCVGLMVNVIENYIIVKYDNIQEN